jgi:multicomponent Na+:H+ antiporter subunit C
MQSALILLFLNYGSAVGTDVPIVDKVTSSIVDPLPQALMITAVVIGASITSLALMFSVKIFHYFGTLYWDALKNIDM